MAKPFIIWVDDERNLIEAEILEIELEYNLDTYFLEDPSLALDWFLNNQNRVLAARAIVIDLLMPANGDFRLKNEDHASPGTLFCQHLMENFEQWTDIQPWLTLYSRSAMNDAVVKARTFAKKNGIVFAEKHENSRIAEELINNRRLRI